LVSGPAARGPWQSFRDVLASLKRGQQTKIDRTRRFGAFGRGARGGAPPAVPGGFARPAAGRDASDVPPSAQRCALPGAYRFAP